MTTIEHPSPAPAAGHTDTSTFDRKKDFARRARVSDRLVDQWIQDRRIPYLKINRTVLIPWREALEALNRAYRINSRSE